MQDESENSERVLTTRLEWLLRVQTTRIQKVIPKNMY